MFGFVTASWKELDEQQRSRYASVYCGICRELGNCCGQRSRICLSYDMAFLALLEMSLYEPEETAGSAFCPVHPIRRKKWASSDAIRYAAEMNALLAYYKAKDDVADEKRWSAVWLSGLLTPSLASIREKWPRQCRAVSECMERLSALEKANTPDPDAAAGCFGELMAELLVMKEDLWSGSLRRMGRELGRFIYLADAMLDYDRDAARKNYNPFLAAGMAKDTSVWEQYLLMIMAECTAAYEKLPLVQDKAVLDNILYSGVWLRWRGYRKKEDDHGPGSV